jgi:asparagine synthase (glutamine-hydrolysing)
MCGIAGLVHLEGGGIRIDWLTRMSAAIRHRGPDDEGYLLANGLTGEAGAFSGPDTRPDMPRPAPPLPSEDRDGAWTLGLAHRRYEILDCTPAAHQPFFDADGRSAVVFNGEIYNFVEVRDYLRDRGATFRTASDTEVIVEAYKALGCECFRHFNGPWAIALYDLRERRLILSRDRIGKRPLYWTRVGPILAFASEIKALMRLPPVAAAKAVNERAIEPFLRRGQRDLDDETCFAGVYSVPAGSYLVVDDRFPRVAARYWRLPSERLGEDDVSASDAIAAVRRTLEDAVRIRLRADVPFAADLSGGLDSSSVVALAARQMAAPLTTYTVGWPEPRFDERPFARLVADRTGTVHRELQIAPGGFWSAVEAFTATEEEPYHSPNLFTSQQIRRQMRADGTRMYLGGAGGDEVFAGYRVHFRALQADALRRGRVGHYVAGPWRWSEGPGVGAALLKPPLDLVRGAPGLSALLREDMLRTRMPYWLRSGDKAHMAVPIESRSPFLDYRVVELAFTLPLTMLVRDGWHKWVVRKAVEDLLPGDIVWRRRKQGFPFPYARFLADSRRQIAEVCEHAKNPWVSRSLPRGDGERRWRHLSWLLWYADQFADDRALFARLAG